MDVRCGTDEKVVSHLSRSASLAGSRRTLSEKRGERVPTIVRRQEVFTEHMKTPIWPYIAVVACLFVLSVLTPRAWLGHAVHAPPPLNTVEVSDPALTAPTILRPESVTSTSMSVAPVAQSTEAENAGTVQETLAIETRRDDSLAEFDSLFRSDAIPLVAPIQPPVGEEIKLDISVTETGEIPAVPQVSTPPLTLAVTPEAQPVTTHEETPAAREKQPAIAIPEVAGAVPRSEMLINGFRKLAQEPAYREWAERIIGCLEQLHHASSLASTEVGSTLPQLFRQLASTPRMAEQSKVLEVQSRVLRLGYAAKRRADIWHQVHLILTQSETAITLSDAGMKQRLFDVEQRLAETEYANEWRQYLLLSELRKMTGPSDTSARRALAKRVLKRIDSPDLSESQIAVFQKSPFEEFSLELRRWASEPIDYTRLLDHLEEYEELGSTDSAFQIAACYDIVRWSPHPELQKLGDLLNTHYRNANVRVALTAEFINRCLPDPQAYQQDVNQNIAGANVHGTSETVNQLYVVLHPDSEMWRIGLEAHGEVASDTAASKGPATFYNKGIARYHARKLLMIDRLGVRVWRAETDVNSETRLQGLQTDYDPIPIFGWLARSVARSQHDQQSESAKVETEDAVRNQASSQFDDEVHRRLEVAEKRVKEKLLAPFERIDLKPTPLDMSTTEQRVIARYRLAADRQLGAQTPRPRAPADSLLSVQVHETALNNTLANLHLEGRRTELIELYRYLSGIFDRPNAEVPEEIPEGVTVQFADQDAVRVRCDDSKVTLTIRIKELKSGRRKFHDFSVRAFYVPDAEQLKANLVREETLQIAGEKLGITERPPLRVIFSKVLSRSQTFNLINKRLAENPKLHDCRVNQFVISDGWIGVGIGPDTAGPLGQTANGRNRSITR